MNSIDQACFSLATNIRGFSLLVVLMAVLGCSEQVQEQSAVTEPVAAPIAITTKPVTPIANESSIQISIEMGVPKDAMEQLLPSSRLFVFAKSASSPMPLAVKVFSLDAIPTNVSLSDADAMMPNNLLSSADDLIVSARVSRAGGAIRASGDWEGIATAPSPDSPKQYHIRIDQLVN